MNWKEIQQMLLLYKRDLNLVFKIFNKMKIFFGTVHLPLQNFAVLILGFSPPALVGSLFHQK